MGRAEGIEFRDLPWAAVASQYRSSTVARIRRRPPFPEVRWRAQFRSGDGARRSLDKMSRSIHRCVACKAVVNGRLSLAITRAGRRHRERSWLPRCRDRCRDTWTTTTGDADMDGGAQTSDSPINPRSLIASRDRCRLKSIDPLLNAGTAVSSYAVTNPRWRATNARGTWPEERAYVARAL